ncbi:MAG: acyl-CoA reductase, partial [Hyphomonadaceae bacterium]
MATFKVPLIIRGRVIEDEDIEFGGRNGAARFVSPDVKKHLADLPLATPSSLADLYELSFDDILDYAERLSERMTLANPHLRQAFELSCETSGLGDDILRATYDNLGAFFERSYVKQHADILIGIPFLDGWVDIRKDNGYVAAVRAFGARAVHIVAGNSPGVSAISMMRNFITRSDAIFKTPSNDPLTAAAMVRVMIDMAPDHPLTKHMSVGYWKGGDAAVEDTLYQPRNIEKLVAWGGLASVQHVTKYIQPGIDLITLDPKLSSTIVGAEAFESEEAMAEAASRVAIDVGAFNQEACLNARVVYIECGTDEAGLAKAKRFGKLLYDSMQALPSFLSTPAKALNPALAQELEALRFAGDIATMIGARDVRGGVIVSHESEPVDFAPLLMNRVANLVPVDNLEIPIRAVTAYTQTIGIYPDSLFPKIRDRLAFHGAQRLVTLGYATRRIVAGPSDGIEPARRMCKWILQERYDPALEP